MRTVGSAPNHTEVDRTTGPAGPWWPPATVLVAQHLGIFWNHYFGTAGIPWDFSMAYYAMVAFWTATVGEGILPQWVPFQQMGYPFALQAQSGMTYLPLWIFPALNIPYTLRAAIVFQCLHVLVGSIGMLVLCTHLLRSRSEALVAAVGFQFFGGFYSNAEHPDIIRAFACAPWLLYAFSLDTSAVPRLSPRALLIPPVLFLFLTGAYPGNVIAGAVMLAVFLACQALDAAQRGVPASRLAGPLVRAGGLGVLGCGMAGVHLGPLLLFREQFSRGEPLLGVERFGLGLEHLPGLFLSNGTLPGEISMTSTFVTLPLVVLACFAPGSAFRKHRVYAGLAVAAALLAAGDRFLPGRLLRDLVPPLGLSRFPSSDYRVFVAIPLILFALTGLRAVTRGQLSRVSLTARSLLCVIGVSWGVIRVHGSTFGDAGRAAVVAVAALLFVAAARRLSTVGTTSACAALLLLMCADAYRVLPHVAGWREPDMDAYYQRQGEPPYTRNRGRRLASSALARSVPPTRPPRMRPPGLIRWPGYLDGSYNMADLTPNVLRSAGQVAVHEPYERYMRMAWTPLLLTSTEAVDADGSRRVDLPLDRFAQALDTPPAGDAGIHQVRYGINNIAYEVSLHEPRLFVENEMYFPGWRARLDTAGGAEIDAVSVNGIFRGWRLPAGHYAMVASFALPHLHALGAVACGSALLWTGLCVGVRRRRFGRAG